jgi:hypothetical protein
VNKSVSVQTNTCDTHDLLACFQFLQNLLMKFKKANAVGGKKASDKSAFVNQVAESLSQCVKTSDDFLCGECPICLEEPRVENAVHSEFNS